TEYQLADMFTKALPEDRFKYLVRRIVKMEILLEPTSNKLLVAESDSSPQAHAQTKKTSANYDKQDIPSRYQVYQGILLASFQDDAKYEHGGQDTRFQGGKDDQDIRIKI
nr:hypothetical protein [Tanacetum cinerariifolium]